MRSVLQLTPQQRRELFVAAAQKLGYGSEVVEKDFWVCWTLFQLFTLPGAGDIKSFSTTRFFKFSLSCGPTYFKTFVVINLLH